MITKENMDKPSRSSPTALTHLRHSEVMHPHPQASQREETETENHSVAGTSISMIEETTPKALVEDFKEGDIFIVNDISSSIITPDISYIIFF